MVMGFVTAKSWDIKGIKAAITVIGVLIRIWDAIFTPAFRNNIFAWAQLVAPSSPQSTVKWKASCTGYRLLIFGALFDRSDNCILNPGPFPDLDGVAFIENPELTLHISTTLWMIFIYNSRKVTANGDCPSRATDVFDLKWVIKWMAKYDCVFWRLRHFISSSDELDLSWYCTCWIGSKIRKTNRVYKFFSSRAKRALEAFLGEVCISVTPNDERRRLNSFDLITGFSGTFKSSKSFCISLIFVPVSGNSYSV